MSPSKDPSAAASSRDQARSRLRTLTRVALFASTGATVGIGIVVAKEHPGSSGATATSNQSSRGANATTPSSESTGNSGTSSAGNTGNSGLSSVAPTITSQRPAVTSGGTSR